MFANSSCKSTPGSLRRTCLGMWLGDSLEDMVVHDLGMEAMTQEINLMKDVWLTIRQEARMQFM